LGDFLNYKFYFSDFIVDPQANLLIKQSSEKRLEPKVITLLSLLASSDNKVISKQQIRDVIWPNVVVGDEAIARAIFTLRKALADDAKNPTYIETIPKKGYRFLVKVSLTQDKSDSSLVKVTPDLTDGLSVKRQRKPTLSLINIMITLFTVAFLVTTILWAFNNNQTDFSSIDRILPVTNTVGNERNFSINHLTNEMVYVHDNGGKIALYVKGLSGKEPVRKITEYDGLLYTPLWLGQETLLYIRAVKGQYQVVRQHKQQEIEVLYQSSNGIYGLALNPASANNVTFVEVNFKQERPFVLQRLSFITGKVSSLSHEYPNMPEASYCIVYSADGSHLFFSSYQEPKTQVYSLELKSAIITAIGEPFDRIEHLALGNRGQLLVSGTHSNIQGLWSVTLDAGSTYLILPASSGQEIINAGVDKQGIVYYSNYERSLDLKLANTSDDSLESLAALNTSADEDGGIFSEDGKFIYYVSNRTGYSEVWSYQIENTRNQQITWFEADYINRPAISQSGKYLAIVYQKNNFNLAVINTSDGDVVNSKKLNVMKFPLAWSKDERFIYISEHRLQVNLYQYDRETLTENLIQNFAGLSVKASDDGENITFFDFKYNGVVEKNLKTGLITKLFSPINDIKDLIPGQVTVNEQHVFYQQHKDKKTLLIQESLTSKDHIKSMAKLIELTEYVNISDISADGQKLLYSKYGIPQGGIMKMQLTD